jgi:hypothetical protein
VIAGKEHGVAPGQEGMPEGGDRRRQFAQQVMPLIVGGALQRMKRTSDRLHGVAAEFGRESLPRLQLDVYLARTGELKISLCECFPPEFFLGNCPEEWYRVGAAARAASQALELQRSELSRLQRDGASDDEINDTFGRASKLLLDKAADLRNAMLKL